MNAIETIKKVFYYQGVIPVIVIEDLESVCKLSDTLFLSGIRVVEITLRTKLAYDAIRDMSKSYSDFIVGAGTVLSVEQANIAVGNGAKFIVSPGFNRKVVKWCLENKVAVYPGVATPTEIGYGIDYGLKCLKFFPAEPLGGLKMLNALSAPYPDISFIPTGGINENNLTNYLSQKYVLAVGGSWVVKKNLIKNSFYEEISSLCRSAMEIVKKVRTG